MGFKQSLKYFIDNTKKMLNPTGAYVSSNLDIAYNWNIEKALKAGNSNAKKIFGGKPQKRNAFLKKDWRKEKIPQKKDTAVSKAEAKTTAAAETPPPEPAPPSNPPANTEIPPKTLEEPSGPNVSVPLKSQDELDRLYEQQKNNIPPDTHFGNKAITQEQYDKSSGPRTNDPGLSNDPTDVERYNHGNSKPPLKEQPPGKSKPADNAQDSANAQANDDKVTALNKAYSDKLQGVFDEQKGENGKLGAAWQQTQTRMNKKLNKAQNMTDEQRQAYSDKHDGRNIYDDIIEEAKSGPSMGDYFYGYHGPTAVGIGLPVASVIGLSNSRGQKSNAELYSDPFA